MNSVCNFVSKSNNDAEISVIRFVYAYSNKYLSALIKSNLGESFTTYLTRKRMERATALMNEGNRSVADVAFFSGYSDPLYFSKVVWYVTNEIPSRD
ncbi:MAG: helix-turn-helix transcriptional regulator [Clostridia bacterium]|nr:helix-turn-helix transcriptional regulator [Clostridia bacterium]